MEFVQAEIKDLDFIVETIIASEKSGSNVLSWSAILDRDEVFVRKIIREALEEDIEGQEWRISNFLIAKDGAISCSVLAGWKEPETAPGSSMVKAQIISFLAPEAWSQATERLTYVSAIQIPRTPGALQLEHIYTIESHRGKGIIGKLIEACIALRAVEYPEMKLAEIQLMSNNSSAIHSYTKCGFLKQATGPYSDFGGLTLLPGNQRISMVRPI